MESTAKSELNEIGSLYSSVEELIRTCAQQRSETERCREAHQSDLHKVFLGIIDLKDALDRLLVSAPSKSDVAEIDIALSNIRTLDKRFERLFRTWSVVQISSIGCSANPDLHQVIDVESVPDKPHGFILREIQKGYTLKGAVLRYATVIAVNNLEI